MIIANETVNFPLFESDLLQTQYENSLPLLLQVEKSFQMFINSSEKNKNANAKRKRRVKLLRKNSEALPLISRIL